MSARSAAGQEIFPLKDVRRKIEQNATDKDAGKQVFLDADPWQSNFASGKLVAEVVEKDLARLEKWLDVIGLTPREYQNLELLTRRAVRTVLSDVLRDAT